MSRHNRDRRRHHTPPGNPHHFTRPAAEPPAADAGPTNLTDDAEIGRIMPDYLGTRQYWALLTTGPQMMGGLLSAWVRLGLDPERIVERFTGGYIGIAFYKRDSAAVDRAFLHLMRSYGMSDAQALSLLTVCLVMPEHVGYFEAFTKSARITTLGGHYHAPKQG